MKRSIALFLLLAPFTAFCSPDFGNDGGGSNILPITSSRTVTETAAQAAGEATEVDGYRIDANFTGVGINVLWSGLRVETQYDISGSTAIGTQHGGSIFAETNSARNNQYFSFGLEDSIKGFVGASATATAAIISHISHVKVFNDQNITQNFPAIAWNPRIDFFNGANENTAFSTHTFGYFIRPEFYRLNQANTGRVFGWYSPSDRSIQNVNAGNVFKVSVSSQVDGGATLDLSQACGGALIITSTATVTLNTTTAFTATNSTIPSSSATGGSYNQDCEVTIINANLVGGRTITIKDTADYIPVAAADSVLGALGGSVKVFSYPTAGVWLGLTAVTK